MSDLTICFLHKALLQCWKPGVYTNDIPVWAGNPVKYSPYNMTPYLYISLFTTACKKTVCSLKLNRHLWNLDRVYVAKWNTEHLARKGKHILRDERVSTIVDTDKKNLYCALQNSVGASFKAAAREWKYGNQYTGQENDQVKPYVTI